MLGVNDAELLLCQTEALCLGVSSATDSDWNQTSIEMKQTVTLFFLLGLFLSRSTTPGKLLFFLFFLGIQLREMEYYYVQHEGRSTVRY